MCFVKNRVYKYWLCVLPLFLPPSRVMQNVRRGLSVQLRNIFAEDCLFLRYDNLDEFWVGNDCGLQGSQKISAQLKALPSLCTL